MRDEEAELSVRQQSLDTSHVGLTPQAKEMSIEAENACPEALRVSAISNEGIDVLMRKIESISVQKL